MATLAIKSNIQTLSDKLMTLSISASLMPFNLPLSKKTQRIITLFSFALVGLVALDAVAYSTPATGSFGYNLYDIGINKIANGPIGFVGGSWLLATGATKLN